MALTRGKASKVVARKTGLSPRTFERAVTIMEKSSEEHA
jgi:hypothetical protein